MSTLKVLKEYLVGSDGGYLLNDDNNGKTVMLSGAWGSGKTHFWEKYIAPELVKNFKDDNRACVYVSLYGKESLKAIKQEVFLKASDETDYLSEEVETFGIDALSSLEDSDANWAKIVKSFWDLNETRRGQKGQNRLKDGGLICFDDFERKSKKVDLNDLFGFISQLGIGLNCKVVIILNSDVFEGEEANVFKTVKEKTVNKFFYFKPEIEELFKLIYESDKKYKQLDKYKDEILKVIEDTEELNARIYIQVLDNCLEWVDKGYNSAGLQALIKTTIFFILTHKVLDYSEEVGISHLQHMGSANSYEYHLLKNYHYIIQKMSILGLEGIDFEETNFNDIKSNIYNELSRRNDKDGGDKYTSEIQQIVLDELKENEKELACIWKYGYRLYYMDSVDEITYNTIANFVETGILIKKDKEQSS